MRKSCGYSRSSNFYFCHPDRRPEKIALERHEQDRKAAFHFVTDVENAECGGMICVMLEETLAKRDETE
jgi:hypothetical protein